MRPASEVERRRLNDTFAELCAIASPFGHERAIADRVTGELRALGLEVEEDAAGEEIGGDAGNLLARLPGRGDRSVLLCAHLDTVPHDGPIEPVLVDGGWESAGETILGADNKAAVAVLLALAHRAAVEGDARRRRAALHGRRGERPPGREGVRRLQAALGPRLRLRPRLADRRDHRRVADLLPPAGAVPRPARPTPASGPRTGAARSSPPRRRSPRCASAASTPRRPPTSARSTAAPTGRTSSPSAARCSPRRARWTRRRPTS